jgi:DUF917 family protein
MKVLSKSDIEDLVVGATILGTGGGGSPEDGLSSLMTQFNQGKKLQVASIEELKSDEIIASPYFVGSVAPTSQRKFSGNKKKTDDPISRAFKLLESRLGQRISATVATELGGGNTAASLAIAAKLDLPTVDGDLMGRAGPELHQSTMHIFSFSMAPSAVVSETGNEFLVENYSGIDDYEAIARYASVIARGHVGVVDSPLEVSKANRCVIKGTISKCIEIGRARRESVEGRNPDPIQGVLSKLDNGLKIFEGVISKYTWKDERGFLFAEAQVSGKGEYKGRKLKSSIVNEHIMCWIDDKPAVMPPDLIMFLDPSTGLGITNDKLERGKQVVVLGSSINKVWRQKKGLELFGPRHFGHPYNYIPFEKLRSG